jgi:hypothetical protein
MRAPRMTAVALAASAIVSGAALLPVPAGAVCSVFDGRSCPHTICSVFDGRPCAPTVCSVFDREPCTPEIDISIGLGLRWTFKSAAIDPHPARTIIPDEVAAPTRKLDNLRAMFNALGGCWIPPAKDEAWSGMEITVRFAFKRSGEIVAAPVVTYVRRDAPESVKESYLNTVRAAMDRCIPLPFAAGLAGAVAGRPVAIRFIENRDLQSTEEQP